MKKFTAIFTSTLIAGSLAAAAAATFGADAPRNTVDKKVAQELTKSALLKIPSNAHSDDAAAMGITFNWDVKQKDAGILTVAPINEAGDYYTFDLLIQCSGTYELMNITDIGRYDVAKNINIKNINMVYIVNAELVKAPALPGDDGGDDGDDIRDPRLLPYDFTIQVSHRVSETGEYLYPPESFANTDQEYIEWLNNVNGFTFVNLYLAATRANNPADIAIVRDLVCSGVTKDSDDASFTLTPGGAGKDMTALVVPLSAGNYAITFWYGAAGGDVDPNGGGNTDPTKPVVVKIVKCEGNGIAGDPTHKCENCQGNDAANNKGGGGQQ